jgi:mono/diheme cytochrome c family protein
MKRVVLTALLLGLAAPVLADDAPYTVKDGMVDAKTFKGFQTWRSAACERCHGANQEGLVGPALTDSLKRMTKDEVMTTIIKGRPEKGMPPHDALGAEKIDALYSYLKGRSDGAFPTKVKSFE